MPKWDRMRNGRLERVRLDVVYDNLQGRRVHIDVAMTCVYVADNLMSLANKSNVQVL